MYGYIYITTNNVNGKQYIGQKTSETFLENKYLGSGKYLGKAINKYGIENFSVEILEECNSKEELNEREIYWIKYYDAVNSDKFYNLQAGGQKGNIAGSKMSEETKKKMTISRTGKHYKQWSNESKIKLSNSMKEFHRNNPGFISGERNGMYGKHISCKIKELLSEKFSGKGNPFYGKKHSEETKRKISESRIGNKNPCYNKIWITRNKENKRIDLSEFGNYEKEGWKKGRYVSERTRQKQSEAKRNRDSKGKFI